MPYPLDKMDLPELQLVFEVLTEIRKKYRSRNSRFITLGVLPKFENVPNNDLTHIITSLADEGVIKKYTTLSMLIGTSISITETFEPFYELVKCTIDHEKYLQDIPNLQIGKISFDNEKSILSIGDYDILIATNPENNKMHAILEYIFIHNADELERKFDYSEIAFYITQDGSAYDSDYKHSHRPYSSACSRINTKIKDTTNGLVPDFLKVQSSTRGYTEITKKYLNQGENLS